MFCPNCGKKLKKKLLDNQNILHCPECGGSFFELNGINRITVSTARELASDKKSNIIVGEQKACPKDQSIMIPVQNEEALPREVTLLKCPTCYGVFAYPEDLLKFKRAQKVKIQFFKIWGKPLPSIQTVLVLSLMVFLFMAIMLSFSTLNKTQLTTTSADEIVKNVYVKKSDLYVFVSFITQRPYRSLIVLTDKTTGSSMTKRINDRPATLHSITVPDIDTSHDIYYQVILVDDKNKEIRTKEVKLTLSP